MGGLETPMRRVPVLVTYDAPLRHVATDPVGLRSDAARTLPPLATVRETGAQA